jgi:hypothetical protein
VATLARRTASTAASSSGACVSSGVPSEKDRSAVPTTTASRPGTAAIAAALSTPAALSIYFVADLIFGDVTFEEAARTVELFEREVIPAFDAVAAK